MTPQEKRKAQLPISDEILLPSSYNEKGDRDFLSIFIVLAKHKFFVLSFVAAGGILATIVAFILPAYYAANVKLLPRSRASPLPLLCWVNWDHWLARLPARIWEFEILLTPIFPCCTVVPLLTK